MIRADNPLNTLDEATAALEDLRRRVAMGTANRALVDRFNEALSTHARLRELLEAGIGSSDVSSETPELPERQGGAHAPDDHPHPALTDAAYEQDRIRELVRLVDRLDVQIRKINDAQSQRLRTIETDLRGRIEQMERRHDALLNGRIFSLLRDVKAACRWPMRLIRRKPSSSFVKVEHKAVAASAVSTQPALPVPPDVSVVHVMPPPDRVRLAGVAYMSRPAGNVRAASITYSQPPLISVVMTCFNTEDYVAAAAESILSQTWPNLELIAVDDCSTDGTRAVLEAMAGKDSRLKLFCFGQNRGTYWCKNFGITKSTGDIVTFMDSDDISLPHRLEEQFALLNHVGKVVTTCNHVRKTPDGKVVAINGVVERIAYISQMVKREVFDEIGYFDTVRTSADDEFLRRIRVTYGRDAEANVKKPLYEALLRTGSLTSDPENAINFQQDRNGGQAFLSPQRRHYAAMCNRWHEHLVAQNLRPFVPFPVVRRPFPVFGKLVVAGERYDGNMISACIASYPPREEKLQLVVERILPQVDHLYVYLNQYDAVPSFLRHSRITVELGKHHGDLRDNGKFFFMDRLPGGYVFTIDDDIDYPQDYVQALIRKLEFYERAVIVGVHGTIYAKPIRSYFKGRKVLHFEEKLECDTIVNQLGTGTLVFHTDFLRPSLAWFKETGMADVWFAVETRRRNMTHIAVERKTMWLAPLGVEESTLFREFRGTDEIQTKAVRSMSPWRELLRPPLNSVFAERSQSFGTAFGELVPRSGLQEEAR